MAADLRSITTFQRISVVLMPDSLIKLEHERTQDRVRRFQYDSIQTVIFWQKPSWGRMIACTVVLILPGIGVLFFDNTPATVIGLLLILLGAALVGWYMYCKVTTIRIVKGGVPHDLKGLFRPGKLRKFRERLLAGIENAQSAAAFSDGLQTGTEPFNVAPAQNQ